MQKTRAENVPNDQDEITLLSDMGALLALLDELANAPEGMLNRVPGAFDILNNGPIAEVSSESTGALELTVRFKPSDRLITCVSALRTLQLDGFVSK